MRELPLAASKVLARPEFLSRFARPRNERVVFTNGCFDVLHHGHVTYLEQARRLGDVLVVGVNTDASVSRLKGSGRPFVSEGDRAHVLAGLGAVDGVTLFDEDTPAGLIAALLPDVLVKGGDYRPEDIVGGDVVEANGGSVVVIPFVEGYSSSDLLDRMREGER